MKSSRRERSPPLSLKAEGTLKLGPFFFWPHSKMGRLYVPLYVRENDRVTIQRVTKLH